MSQRLTAPAAKSSLEISTKKPAIKITIINANNGRTDKTLSTFALLSLFVLSVTNALNAASFAVLPKNVITQSIMTIIVPATKTLLATMFNEDVGSKNANNRIEIPQRI